jgi:N-acetylneuraminic acid mutarotase
MVAAATGDKIYAIGGRLGSSYHKNLDVNEVYIAEKNQWERRAPLPTPRSGIGAGILKGLLLIVGGEGSDGTFHENEAYDPVTDSWRSLSPLPTARHGLGSVVIDERFYVISGGTKPGGSRSNVVEVFRFK